VLLAETLCGRVEAGLGGRYRLAGRLRLAVIEGTTQRVRERGIPHWIATVEEREA
jgi:hypothetical protein